MVDEDLDAERQRATPRWPASNRSIRPVRRLAPRRRAFRPTCSAGSSRQLTSCRLRIRRAFALTPVTHALERVRVAAARARWREALDLLEADVGRQGRHLGVGDTSSTRGPVRRPAPRPRPARPRRAGRRGCPPGRGSRVAGVGEVGEGLRRLELGVARHGAQLPRDLVEVVVVEHATTRRGLAPLLPVARDVISSAMPFICMAPSPTNAITGRSGWANLAAERRAPPGPSWRACPTAIRSCRRASEVAGVPVGGANQSAVTIASSGSRGESSRRAACGLTGSASTRSPAASMSPTSARRCPRSCPPAPVVLAPQQRNQRPQRRGGVADEVDLVRVAHADHAAVDVDLHARAWSELRHELGVREAGPDGQQRVAALIIS